MSDDAMRRELEGLLNANKNGVADFFQQESANEPDMVKRLMMESMADVIRAGDQPLRLTFDGDTRCRECDQQGTHAACEAAVEWRRGTPLCEEHRCPDCTPLSAPTTKPKGDTMDETIELHEMMAALYASEINCKVESFWDGGWTVAVGDIQNGFKATRQTDDVAEIAELLRTMAIECYPKSDFAKAHGKAERSA